MGGYWRTQREQTWNLFNKSKQNLLWMLSMLWRLYFFQTCSQTHLETTPPRFHRAALLPSTDYHSLWQADHHEKTKWTLMSASKRGEDDENQHWRCCTRGITTGTQSHVLRQDFISFPFFQLLQGLNKEHSIIKMFLLNLELMIFCKCLSDKQ